jgi:hypothetical protein
MGVLYTHSPKMPGPSPNNPKKKKKKKKNKLNKKQKKREKGGQPTVRQTTSRGQRAAGRMPAAHRSPFFPCCIPLFSSFFPHFWALWSTPPHWLHHTPALPRLLLKTSNTYNFLFICPKIMKFVLTRSLLRDAC